MTFKIEWVEGGVFWNYSGTVSSEEILESNKEVYGDERFDQIRFEVVNFLDTNGIEFTAKDVRIVAALDRAAALTNPRIRVVLLATEPRIVEILQAYLQGIRGGPWIAQVFSSLDEAAVWLGGPLPASAPELAR
jgi:hypothetical protein